ncbi:MAG: TetR/AcrR family transcriptional regulator [Treponema sp.]|nr:TetR/AcrR family transcriptional regulator [Treponema sp.]
MQFLKDDIKNDIIKAALAEFSEKGYRDSSMRVIAAHAGIVMGTIYRYFDNKEALFRNAVGSVYDRIAGITSKIQVEIEAAKDPWEDEQAQILIRRFYNQMLEAFSGHGKELLILLDKSVCSPYENTRQELIARIQNILEERLSKEVKTSDPFIFYVLASAFVEGVCVVLRDTGSHDREAVIGSLCSIMFCQISKRI